MTAVTTTKAEPKVALLRTRIERMKESLAIVYGGGTKGNARAERTAKLTILYFTQKEALANCDVESIAQSVLQIAQWGLELGTTAHIVPRKGKACAQKDWKGEVLLARESGAINSCRPVIIRDCDDFEVQQGLAPVIKHVVDWKNTKAKPVGAYAVVHLPSGDVDFEVMSTEQIEKVRARSSSSDKGPWVSDWEEMAKKTVVRRLLKRYQASNEADDEDEPAIPQGHVEPVGQRVIPTPADAYALPESTAEVVEEPKAATT